MSWDVRWKLRWRQLDMARITAAVEAERGTLETRLERRDETSAVAFVHVDGGWGQIDFDMLEVYPHRNDAPYEVLSEKTEGTVHSLCNHRGTAFAATFEGHAYYHHDFWRPLESDNWIYAVGTVGDAVLCASESTIWRYDRGNLVPHSTLGTTDTWVALHGEAADDAWLIGRDSTLHHWNGDRWAIAATELGVEVKGFLRTRSGLYLSTNYPALVRVERAAVTPIDWFPDDNDFDQPDAAGVDARGDIWLACRPFVTRWDGSTWTVTRADISRVRALVTHGDELVAVGTDGDAARWDGREWHPFTLDVGTVHAACAGVDGDLYLGGEGELITLEPRGPYCSIAVGSSRSGNAALWEPVTDLAGRIADRLGAGPAR